MSNKETSYVIVHPRNGGFGGYVAYTNESAGVGFLALRDPLDRDSEFEISKADALYISSETYDYLMGAWERGIVPEGDETFEFGRRVSIVLREDFGITWLGNG